MFGPYKERREAHGAQLYSSASPERPLPPQLQEELSSSTAVALFIASTAGSSHGQWADLGGISTR
jgi:hypothetical protein